MILKSKFEILPVLREIIRSTKFAKSTAFRVVVVNLKKTLTIFALTENARLAS